MKILLLRSAVEDLKRGSVFYECQGEGLGEYFEDALLADVESLIIYGGIHPKEGTYHRMLSGRFPYAIYYTVAEETVKVSAILDCRRDPKWIRSKLDDRGRTSGRS